MGTHPNCFKTQNGQSRYLAAYDYKLQAFKASGNTHMVSKLEAAPVALENGIPEEYLSVRDVAMHSLGIGTMHEMKSIVTGLFLPSLMFREYSLGEKIKLWRAKARNGVSVMCEDSLHTDLSQQVTELDLPVYFMEGMYDYTCNYTLARDYFEKIHAPVKGFYILENSAHSPLIKEPEKTRQILQEIVVNGVANPAGKMEM
jgi:pimeloyl-ACP methyl ester carboxylesterase